MCGGSRHQHVVLWALQISPPDNGARSKSFTILRRDVVMRCSTHWAIRIRHR